MLLFSLSNPPNFISLAGPRLQQSQECKNRNSHNDSEDASAQAIRAPLNQELRTGALSRAGPATALREASTSRRATGRCLCRSVAWG